MINPELYYTPKQITTLASKGFFPIKARATLMKLIKSNVLKSVRYDTGGIRPYFKVKGSELIRFVEFGDIGSYGETVGIQEQGGHHQ